MIGIVGKPSAGKSQFLNAACMTSAKTADYPFTTIEPNLGTAYVRHKCLCKELNVKDNPRNSICINGTRLIPVSLLDVAGLVPDAWKGRGLGNKFLDDLRRADALIHVVDASGSLDEEGRAVEAGSWDPLKDIEFLEREITMWLLQIIKRDWSKLTRTALTCKKSFLDILSERVAGLGITKSHIISASAKLGISIDKADKWSEEEIYRFVDQLRSLSKPMVLALNKIDKPTAKKNVERLIKIFPNAIPVCALAEYFLRQLAEKNIINYIPGDKEFTIIKPEVLSENDRKILERVKTDILEVYGSTGVQQVLDKIVFEILGLIAVYPVEDVKNYCDHNNLVLPDVYLVPKGTTARQLAYMIHSDLGEGFIYAVDGRTKQRLAENYELKDGDLIKIVSAKSLK